MSEPTTPPETQAVNAIDIRAVREGILESLGEAERRLEQAQARVWMLRGQLDLLAQLAAQAPPPAGA